ncbi:homoserine kinase [Anaerolineae bacterium CFX9]|nr:homoserine kinase [Anaerolineae bacterium CFX9]
MNKTSVEAYAPATIANLGSGFDILGLALGEPGDVVGAEFADKAGVHIAAIEGDGGKLPHVAEKNTAGVAAISLLRLLGETRGVSLRIRKGLPLASGLGSSSSSAVAAALAVNALLGSPLSREELLPACLDGEAAVSGYHADNVAPCLFGGIVLAYGVHADEIRQLPVPPNLHLALVTPGIEVPTSEARAVLPKTVTLSQMIHQTAAIARLIDALYRGDVPAVAAAMEADAVIEPARAHLMPRIAEVRAEAKAAGAHGLIISGAGPTLCAICSSREAAEAAGSAMHAVYSEARITAQTQITQVSPVGARLLV